MLQDINKQNRDITETLNIQNGEDLEDAIFMAMDKLDALCVVQAQMEQGEGRVAGHTRSHYLMIVEDQVRELRKLLTEHFG